MTMSEYDTLTLSQAIDLAIRESVIASREPDWCLPPLQVGDVIEDLEIPIPGERHNRVRRTVVVEPRHAR